MAAYDEELVEAINHFWEEHDLSLENELYLAHIERECERGTIRYKNGRNLKDGLDIIDGDQIPLFNPIEMYQHVMERRIKQL